MPRDETYFVSPGFRDFLHLGIVPSGELALMEGKPAPRGGIVLERAQREYELSCELIDAGVRTALPLAVYQYRDLTFSGGGSPVPLGLVVSALPDAEPYRPSVILELRSWDDDDDERTKYVANLAGQVAFSIDEAEWPRQRLDLASHIYGSIGARLRQFNESGYFRYSAHLENFVYSTTLAELLLVDLDTSERSSAVNSTEWPLQVVRDIVSGMFNFSCSFFIPDFVDLNTGSDFSDSIFHPYLTGYFPELDIPEDIGSRFLRYVVARRERVAVLQRTIMDNPTGGWDLLRQTWMDLELTFSALFRLCFELYGRSALATKWPLPYDLPALDDVLVRFAGWRRARFGRWLSGDSRDDAFRDPLGVTVPPGTKGWNLFY